MAALSAISDTSRDEAAFAPSATTLGTSTSRRTRVRSGKTKRTAFSPTGKDDFHVPEKFAKLWGR